jgi:hypothetical protein
MALARDGQGGAVPVSRGTRPRHEPNGQPPGYFALNVFILL